MAGIVSEITIDASKYEEAHGRKVTPGLEDMFTFQNKETGISHQIQGRFSEVIKTLPDGDYELTFASRENGTLL